MFDRQPVLTGDLISLRPLRADDWDDLFAVASHKEIWAMHPMHNRWREEVFREFFDEALASNGTLIVEDRASGMTIGSSRYDALDEAGGGSVEIGWTFLHPDYWGTGHNRDMKHLMAGHALESVARVDFRVGETNWRSRKALEKIGARISAGRVERPHVPGIGEVLHLYYELTRPDFARVLGAN